MASHTNENHNVTTSEHPEYVNILLAMRGEPIVAPAGKEPASPWSSRQASQGKSSAKKHKAKKGRKRPVKRKLSARDEADDGESGAKAGPGTGSGADDQALHVASGEGDGGGDGPADGKASGAALSPRQRRAVILEQRRALAVTGPDGGVDAVDIGSEGDGEPPAKRQKIAA